MKDITLSLAQMHSVVGDTDGNLDHMKEMIGNVRGYSDIICFPEASLTGYDADDPNNFCIDGSDPRISEISDLSKKYDINIIFGFMEKQGHDMFISQVLSDRGGNISFYRKTHLGRKERRAFVPGNQIPVFRLPEATVGLQLCWESHFPDISTKMRKDGAEIILISYASPLPPDKRRETWMKHLPARAYDNGVFIGAVNMVGDNGTGTIFGGGIMAFDPKGRILAERFVNDDVVVSVNLSSSIQNKLGSDEHMGNTDYFLYRRDDIY
jgi:predicted amidohydrolase